MKKQLLLFCNIFIICNWSFAQSSGTLSGIADDYDYNYITASGRGKYTHNNKL